MELRSVEFCERGGYGPFIKEPPQDISKGFFHKFVTEGSQSESLETYAIIETEKGEIRTIPTYRFIFKDKKHIEKNLDIEHGLDFSESLKEHIDKLYERTCHILLSLEYTASQKHILFNSRALNFARSVLDGRI